jgi:hypothetical protein
MATIRTIDRRREPRTQADLGLVVWGVDNKGERFLQEARARDISLSGALRLGLDTDLRSGDVIGILYAGWRARFCVVFGSLRWRWRQDAGRRHRVDPDICPWQDLSHEPCRSRPPSTLKIHTVRITEHPAPKNRAARQYPACKNEDSLV